MLVFYSKTWNHSTVSKPMSSGLFKNVTYKLFIYKSYIFNTYMYKIKWDFFQAVAVSLRLYGCTTWMLSKCMEKRLDGNYTRMLHVVLNKSWKQHLMKYQLYGHLPPISKTIQVRGTRHAGHCRRSKHKIICNVFLWAPTHR